MNNRYGREDSGNRESSERRTGSFDASRDRDNSSESGRRNDEAGDWRTNSGRSYAPRGNEGRTYDSDRARLSDVQGQAWRDDRDRWESSPGSRSERWGMGNSGDENERSRGQSGSWNDRSYSSQGSSRDWPGSQPGIGNTDRAYGNESYGMEGNGSRNYEGGDRGSPWGQTRGVGSYNDRSFGSQGYGGSGYRPSYGSGGGSFGGSSGGYMGSNASSGTSSNRGPFWGKGPKGYKRSDERIKEDVSEKLSLGHVDASDIEIQVREGEVTLSGTVPSRDMKRTAEELIEDVSGVNEVSNQLRVKREESAASSDRTQATGGTANGNEGSRRQPTATAQTHRS